jgi:hypothetical protein
MAIINGTAGNDSICTAAAVGSLIVSSTPPQIISGFSS